MKEEEEETYGVREPAGSYNYINEEEYLESERAALDKHEYYRGKIFAMSEIPLRHNFIFTNVLGLLAPLLKSRACFPYGSDFRLHIPKNTLYTYPDITIVCGELKMKDDGEKDNLLNPSVIIEILSKSTRKYDRGLKFTLYKDIDSFSEYILIDSMAVSVEQFIRNDDNSWHLSEYKLAGEQFTIKKVNITLPISDVYERTGLL